MTNRIILFVRASASVILGAFSLAAMAATPAPPGTELYFITPDDGATVSNPVTVKFGLRGMGVAPAGVVMENTGHHHLLIDVEDLNFSTPVPQDDQHIHFGGGQTETVVNLTPGEHTLQLLLGDFAHIPHDPPVVSERITVIVE